MQLSSSAIQFLANIIMGETNVSPRRTGPELINFFREFGERDLYGSDFPSRKTYTIEKLNKFNGSAPMEKIVAEAFMYFHEKGYNPEEEAQNFNRLIATSRARLIMEYTEPYKYEGEYRDGEPYFVFQNDTPELITTSNIAKLSDDYIKAKLQKAERRILEKDYSGAITISASLTESILKLLLDEMDVAYKPDLGDIRKLYDLVKTPLGLNPSGESIDSALKPIMDGFQKLIAGLYNISNKAGDRHRAKYSPAKRHAQLALNASLALCEYLIESNDIRLQNK